MAQFIAHRRETDGKEQSVFEHLEGTAELARDFAAAFGAGDEGYRIGMLHDLGKYSDAFQRRIRGSSEKTDHSTAGAQEAAKLGDAPAALCIAGHHGGLPDCGNKQVDAVGSPTLAARLKKTVQPYAIGAREVTAPAGAPLPAFATKGFPLAFYIRMLFSGLVDADFLNTEAFMRPQGIPRGVYLPLHALLAQLQAYVQPWLSPTGDLNRMRCDVLRACIDAGAQPPGLFKLTVPTGGGKTISSAAFALHHAVKNSKRRIIYVIPYISIIEQTVQVFREIFGEDQVVAHYSSAEPNEGEDAVTSAEISRRLAAENWDAPIVVTTAVQFFESLFACKTSRCRKLHNIAQSVVILDEAQMIPVPYLRPCIAAVGELVAHYGVSAVLCTATQPALDALLAEFLPGKSARELCPNVETIFPKFRRVRYENPGLLAPDALTQRLSAHEQVLCIVNRRKEAQEFFANLPPEGSFCLTTLMTPTHRQATLAIIRQRLQDGLPCRVVATSLIECGVDVDFPVAYRAECGLDSLVQAAGRCNRENKRPPDSSVVYSFRTEQPAPALFSQNIDAARAALENRASPDAPETQTRYFELLYRLKGSAALDQKQILRALAGNSEHGALPFATVAAAFRLIETAAVNLYIPHGKGAELLEQLRRDGPSRKLLAQLGAYGVSVYPDRLSELLRCGSAEQIGDNLFALRDKNLYCEKTGLASCAQEGQALIL